MISIGLMDEVVVTAGRNRGYVSKVLAYEERARNESQRGLRVQLDDQRWYDADDVYPIRRKTSPSDPNYQLH